ncbi:hypothetical protein KRM28CT15_26700 [Krasilnikovia sp. M28-CT-15]
MQGSQPPRSAPRKTDRLKEHLTEKAQVSLTSICQAGSRRPAQPYRQDPVVQGRLDLVRVDIPRQCHHELELPDPPRLAAQYSETAAGSRKKLLMIWPI